MLSPNACSPGRCFGSVATKNCFKIAVHSKSQSYRHVTDRFRARRIPFRIDAKRGDHFLQADFERSRSAPDASREANGAVVACGLR